MIRLSRLFTFGVKSRRVNDLSSTICSGTFPVNESCYGQITNHRLYATGARGINVICCIILLLFHYKNGGG
jgi:hypothetical protein